MSADEVTALLAAIVALIGLGLAMGFSPTLYGVSLRLLMKSSNGVRSIAFVTFGMAVAATIQLLVFHSVNPSTVIDALRGDVTAALVQRSVDLIAAAAFTAGGIVLKVRRRRYRTPHEKRRRSSSSRDLFVVGFVETVLGISNIATSYVADRVISAANPQLAWRLAAYLVFLVSLAGPYLAVGYAWERLPSLARAAKLGYAWVSRRDWRPVLTAALFAGSIVFLVLAIHD